MELILMKEYLLVVGATTNWPIWIKRGS